MEVEIQKPLDFLIPTFYCGPWNFDLLFNMPILSEPDGSSQLQTGDKLLAETFLTTEIDVENFFPHCSQFLSCFTASEKSAALQPMTL